MHIYFEETEKSIYIQYTHSLFIVYRFYYWKKLFLKLSDVCCRAETDEIQVYLTLLRGFLGGNGQGRLLYQAVGAWVVEAGAC